MSKDRWLNKDVVCIYSRILLRHKKEVVSFVATWMDLEIIIQSEEQDSTRFLKGKYRPYRKALPQDGRWRCKRGTEMSRSFPSSEQSGGKESCSFSPQTPISSDLKRGCDGWSGLRRICKFQCESWESCSVLPTSQENTGAFEKPYLWKGISLPFSSNNAFWVY